MVTKYVVNYGRQVLWTDEPVQTLVYIYKKNFQGWLGNFSNEKMKCMESLFENIQEPVPWPLLIKSL